MPKNDTIMMKIKSFMKGPLGDWIGQSAQQLGHRLDNGGIRA
jgi:hypothetical protein